MTLDSIDHALIDGWQRDFPLTLRPFRSIADELRVPGADLRARLLALMNDGVISRVGAVVRPHTAGASTLAAMQVPAAEIERVAALVNEEPGVNHNYEREHELNLWFVATAADVAELAALIGRIETATGLRVLQLPLVRTHHIDLGFSLDGRSRRVRGTDSPVSTTVTGADRRLLAAIEEGLPIVSRPYQSIADRLGWSESEVISRLADLIDGNVIARFGLVVRHRQLGFTANAMAVWHVNGAAVDALGDQFARQPFVTLCYQRRAALPLWPYTLYCMIHGRERAVVLEQIGALNELAKGSCDAHEVLFSTRCFRQQGARFSRRDVAERQATGEGALANA